MILPIFHVDAFAARRFESNPAAVIELDGYPEDAQLQAHAAENNLAETAFLVREGADGDAGAGLRYVMDFPARRCRLVRLSGDAWVRSLAPDLGAIAALEGVVGVIVTATGAAPYDIVSRYFAPLKGIPEDPVTGGAHCALAPFWSERLGRRGLRAWQASERGGDIGVRLLPNDRVALEGSCVFYSEGQLS